MTKRIKSISVRIKDRYDERFLSKKQKERKRNSPPKPPVVIEVGRTVPSELSKGYKMITPVEQILFKNNSYLVKNAGGGYLDMHFSVSEVFEVTYFDDNGEITETKE